MCTRTFQFIVVALILRPSAFGGDPAKLEATVIPLKVVREQNVDLQREVAMVRLPEGKITLRDADGKEREERVKPVWMAKFKTRWNEYSVFYDALDLTEDQWRKNGFRSDKTRIGALYASRMGFLKDEYPVNSVTLAAAKKYCDWLSKNTGKKFRLPTEAEWEYAARAGGGPLKLDEDALAKVAWYQKNSDEETHPVGRKQPNAWGLYDMLGNVAEYVIRDPKDEKGLVAGGAWSTKALDVHSGAREAYTKEWVARDPQDPPNRDWLEWTRLDIGFRVVMEE